jgi:hypothetical protein
MLTREEWTDDLGLSLFLRGSSGIQMGPRHWEETRPESVGNRREEGSVSL